MSTRKALFYRTIQNDNEIAPYLDILTFRPRITMTKFRLSNHRLPVEKGRWEKIDFQDRVCPFCTPKELGDEFHYIFVCSKFSEQRKRYIDKKYVIHPNVYKSNQLFNSSDYSVLQKLAKFIDIINQCVST